MCSGVPVPARNPMIAPELGGLLLCVPQRATNNWPRMFQRLQPSSKGSNSDYLVCSSHPSSLPPNFP